jgi:hypothetical protein
MDLHNYTEIKEYISTLQIVYTADYPHERTVRNIISELRKEGLIFIPSSLGKGIYITIENASETEVVNFYNSQEKHFKTQYFNTMLPIKNWIKQNNNAKLMGRLEGTL